VLLLVSLLKGVWSSLSELLAAGRFIRVVAGLWSLLFFAFVSYLLGAEVLGQPWLGWIFAFVLPLGLLLSGPWLDLRRAAKRNASQGPGSAPPALRRWDNRIAEIWQGGKPAGQLLVEAVYCYMHDDEPEWEIDCTIRLTGSGGDASYETFVPLYWEVAIDEFKSNRFSWRGQTVDLVWLDRDEASRLRYRLFD
jgi:hypothetical protein